MNQYAIIVVPSPEICQKVDKYRKKFAKYTNYVITPHFTVYPPFYIEPETKGEIISILKKSFVGTEVKTINFEGIGFFEEKNNVAFFKPDKESEEYLRSLLIKATKALQGRVKNVYNDYNFTPEKFKPHMTIAEKIPDDTFKEVKRELNNLVEKDSFPVLSVFLFKQAGGSNLWNNEIEILF